MRNAVMWTRTICAIWMIGALCAGCFVGVAEEEPAMESEEALSSSPPLRSEVPSGCEPYESYLGHDLAWWIREADKVCRRNPRSAECLWYRQQIQEACDCIIGGGLPAACPY